MSEPKYGSMISYAHSIDPLKTGKLADASKNLKEQYAKAIEGREQKQVETAKQQMPSTSHAKTVQMDWPKNKLDGVAAKDIRGQYQRAAEALPSHAQKSQQQTGSEMIRKDSPQLKPAPKGAMREGADRQAFNQKLAADHAKAINANAQKSGHNSQKNIDLDRGKGG